MASSLTNKIMNFRLLQKFTMREMRRIFMCIMLAYNSANDDGFSADFSPFCKSKSHYGIDYGVSYAYTHSPAPKSGAKQRFKLPKFNVCATLSPSFIFYKRNIFTTPDVSREKVVVFSRRFCYLQYSLAKSNVCWWDRDTQEEVEISHLVEENRGKKHEASKAKVKSFVYKTQKVDNEIMENKTLVY